MTVLDDRPDFAHPSRFPDCEVIAEDFIVSLRTMRFGPSTYVVVITRGHEHDADYLAEIVRKEKAYVGLIRKAAAGSIRPRDAGPGGEFNGAPSRSLHSDWPSIGAESPEEIALSIVAELVWIRRKGHAVTRDIRASGQRFK